MRQSSLSMSALPASAPAPRPTELPAEPAPAPAAEAPAVDAAPTASPDDDLTQLNYLIIEKSCRMTDQEVDQAYRTIRSLEELSDILKDGPQEERINRFLEGMHQIIDKKLKEFFYP